ncbi:NmrA family NAD(P)-binding protein [Paenibacillus ihuae]|uniref:NmrA family NAD(P)-binding protein n=1 Tax=Paenibacillus ihuae TaxID=1232431 RepID=UPI0006D57939
MKIAVIGASGKDGSGIVKKALSRGHEVTAIMRGAAKAADSGAAVLEKDVLALRADDLRGFGAVLEGAMPEDTACLLLFFVRVDDRPGKRFALLLSQQRGLGYNNREKLDWS